MTDQPQSVVLAKDALQGASKDEVFQRILNQRDLFFRHDLSTQHKDPTSFFDFFFDAAGKVVVRPKQELENWLLNISSSMVSGSTYSPAMDIGEASAWRNWTNSEGNRPLYNLLMQLSPAFKAADFQASMSIRAYEFKNDEIPGEKVMRIAQEEIAKQPSIIDAVVSVPAAAAEIAGVASNVLNEIWNTLLEILKLLNDVIWPAIDQMWTLMKENMKPALDVLNEQILEPFKEISTDGKVAFERYRKMIEEQGRRVDASVPPIVGPNIDEYAKILPVLAKYFSLPIFGDIAKAELQTMSMVDYQATQMRGFATPLKMLEYAAGMTAPAGPGQAAMDLATKPPQWFLSNL